MEAHDRSGAVSGDQEETRVGLGSREEQVLELHLPPHVCSPHALGYWNGGRGCSIETLAELIGDTPKVAFDHYGKEWGQHYQDPTLGGHWRCTGQELRADKRSSHDCQ